MIKNFELIQEKKAHILENIMTIYYCAFFLKCTKFTGIDKFVREQQNAECLSYKVESSDNKKIVYEAFLMII